MKSLSQFDDVPLCFGMYFTLLPFSGLGLIFDFTDDVDSKFVIEWLSALLRTSQPSSLVDGTAPWLSSGYPGGSPSGSGSKTNFKWFDAMASFHPTFDIWSEEETLE